MNIRYVLVSMFVGMSMRADYTMPHEVEELAAQLQRKNDVASVQIDGYYAGTQHLPSCSFCHRLKDDTFQDPAVRAWYTAFSACRCAEHHELIRSAAWLSTPAVGAGAGWMGGVYIADRAHFARKLLALPCALIAAVQACKLHTKLYRWLGDLLDGRADAAAVKSCTSQEDIKNIMQYLATKEAETTYRDTGQEYQLFCVNAYDAAQSNLCSFITIHVQLPVPWLPSGDEIKAKLSKRIRYLQNCLSAARE
jgi:hypothetical protein